MKSKFLLLVLTLFSCYLGFSQLYEPVEWSTSVNKIGEDEYELIANATVEPGWHLYSQHVPEDGPIPTTFYYEELEGRFEMVGETIEEEGHTILDPVFEMEIKYFEDGVQFKQHIKTISNINVVNAFVEFMVCDDEKCLPPTEVELVFELSEGAGIKTDSAIQNTEKLSDNSVNQKLYGMQPDDLKIEMGKARATTSLNSLNENDKSLWRIFGLGFLGGLLALLTPCVFPMIPLTVSFFTKKNTTDKKSGIVQAVAYGFFILAVYLLLSVPFHLLDSVNPDILNDISTNVWLNMVFFLVFVFFAFSFFGYYELTLPSSWTAKTTSRENSKGWVGIFFMALTLALVSFSCTGPILGSLLAGSLSANGGAIQLTAGMGGFGLALGLPFALFAMFPNLLSSLPKSGGWMNTVKVVLGFLELALAFKFLSNADLVAHWEILKIEPFLGIWILIFAGLALYLFGKIKFPHDSPIAKLSFFRVATGILVTAFTIYLISGFRINKETNTFTPLKLLSGLAPPVGYSFFLPNDCPNNLNCFKDLKTGVAHAKETGKPILLDFTGFACVNCRKMEEHVWSIPKIDKILREEYVLISLYVDDKKELPEVERLQVQRPNGGKRVLKNYGHKWANFQTQFFQTNSQPYYVVLNSEGNSIVNEPVAYTPNADEYYNWLVDGISKF